MKNEPIQNIDAVEQVKRGKRKTVKIKPPKVEAKVGRKATAVKKDKIKSSDQTSEHAEADGKMFVGAHVSAAGLHVLII